MEAYLDWQKKSGGIKLNDVIEEYKYVANGKSVKKGDLLTYVGEDVAPAIEPPFNAVALSDGVGVPEFVEQEVTKTDNAFLTTWENVSDGEAVGANGNVLTVDLSGVNSGSLISSSCDGNESSYSEISMDSIRWVKMELSNPLKITNMKLKFTVGNANAFDYAKIEGSNNNSEWIELYRTTSAISSLTEIPLNNPDYYKYYRIYISSSISTTAAIKLYEWQTSEYIVKEQVPSTEHNEQVKIARVPNKLSMLPVGTLIKDVNSTFLGEPVIWKIADKNHEGYPDGSVTLITERSIAMRCFDAKEPNNSDTDRTKYGNNRYSVSNIRQWLNSDAEAGQWYSAQHSADQSPTTDYASVNAYSDDSGFLNGFSDNFKNSLLGTTLITALNTVTDGGGSEMVVDKIFLASNTEVGVANENSIAEGSLLSIFGDNTSRIAYCTTEAIEDSAYTSDPANDTTAWDWLLRTPVADKSGQYRYIHRSGTLYNDLPYNGTRGVRPLCNIPSSIRVSETPDTDGCYTLFSGGEA